MGFQRVASAGDLAPGNMKGFEAGGKQIVIINLGGSYYAIGDRCTHMGCLLSDGRLEGDSVLCVCHGSVFNVKDGSVKKGPARKPEPVFEVKVEGEQILVNV